MESRWQPRCCIVDREAGIITTLPRRRGTDDSMERIIVHHRHRQNRNVSLGTHFSTWCFSRVSQSLITSVEGVELPLATVQ